MVIVRIEGHFEGVVEEPVVAFLGIASRVLSWRGYQDGARGFSLKGLSYSRPPLSLQRLQFSSQGTMKPRICICCGEAMSEKGNALSRNPNVCASCSSLADGMDEPNAPETKDLEP